jgi:hypothetical protein
MASEVIRQMRVGNPACRTLGISRTRVAAPIPDRPPDHNEPGTHDRVARYNNV